MRQTRMVALVVAGILAAASGYASAAPARKITQILLEGNRQMSNTAVLAQLRSRVGDVYSEQTLLADEQRLLKTGRFLNVEASARDTATGVTITIVLTERPLVAAVVLKGNKSIKDAELRKELPFGTSDPLNEYLVNSGKEALESAYRKKGYHFVRVTIDRAELGKSRRVIYTITEGPRVYIRKINYRGNRFFKTMELRMKAESTRRIWPFSAGALDSEQIERDVDSFRTMYVDEGFLDCEVGRELAFSADKSQVTLTFVFREGPRYRINEVRFKGNTVFSGRQLASRLKLRKGTYLSSLTLQRDTKRVENAYGELGYIEARVSVRKVYKEQPGVLDLVYTIVERDKFTVGEITIRGNTITQARVIRRELRFYPEQVYNTVAVDGSRSRLLESRLFDAVTITPTGNEKGVRNAVVQVTEGRTAEFLVGFGVSSSSGLLGNISFTQRNFNIFNPPRTWAEWFSTGWKGAGQRFSIVAEPGTELMRYHIEWFTPYIFDKPYSLGVKGFIFTRGRESYDETRYGGVVSVGHRFKNRWYGEFALRMESVQIDSLDYDAPADVRAVQGSNLLVGLKGTLVRDRTDSRYSPSRGDRITVSAEPVVGDHEFTTLTGDYRFYRTLWIDALDRKHVLASRFTASYICGDAPVFERFYGGGNGGYGAMRGFEYRGISPRPFPGSNDPIGGHFMVFAGTEYRFPIVGARGKGELQGVVFLDSGTVERDFELTTYRVSAGFGLRWFIPMFGPVPISLDFGIPLLKDSDDDTQLISFSFGWRF